MFEEAKRIKDQIETHKIAIDSLDEEYKKLHKPIREYIKAILDVTRAQIFPEWKEDSIVEVFQSFGFEYCDDGVIVKYRHFISGDYLPYSGHHSDVYTLKIPAASFDMIQLPSDQIGQLLDYTGVLHDFKKFVAFHRQTIETCFVKWKYVKHPGEA